VGIAIYFIGLTYGGWIQGMEMNKGETPFMEIIQLTIPYLKSRTIGGSLMTLGHVAFAISFVWMLFARPRQNSSPTLFKNPAQS